jgi:hypothetical protein
VLHELPQELQRDVRDDLDVHPGVVVDLHAHDRVDVRHVPPGLQLPVLVDALEERAQLAVAADGDAHAHRVHRLGGGHACLATGLLGDRLLDPLVPLVFDGHRA